MTNIANLLCVDRTFLLGNPFHNLRLGSQCSCFIGLSFGTLHLKSRDIIINMFFYEATVFQSRGSAESKTLSSILPRNHEGCWFCGCVCGVCTRVQPSHRHRHESPTQEKRKCGFIHHVSFSHWGQVKYTQATTTQPPPAPVLSAQPAVKSWTASQELTRRHHFALSQRWPSHSNARRDAEPMTQA